MSIMPLLSVVQAAKRLNLSERRVQKLCQDKRLGQLVGDIYVISEDDVKRFAKLPRKAGRPKSSNPAR